MDAKTKAKLRKIQKESRERLEEVEKRYTNNQWYSLRSLLGYYNWAIFYVLLGARETGKSYAVMDFFVHEWKTKGIPFTWIRLNEGSTKKLLNANAEKFVDPDIARRWNLKLTVKGNSVYDDGKKMATIVALSTFYSDKGVGMFDKDFLNNEGMSYHICLDEFQKEKTERSQGDICYQFVNQMENLVRSTKERIRCFLIGNTLEEASDILTMFNFIPEKFGRFKIKKKRAVIDYLPPSDKYLERRKGTISDLLTPTASNFTNIINFDKTLINKKPLKRPTAIIHFDKNTKYTLWDDRTIAPYNKESIKTHIAMRPYIDLLFNQELRDKIIALFDARYYYYKNLITFKKFQKEIQLIKPRKQ